MTDLLDYDEDELLEMAADPDTSISRLMKLLDTENFDEEIAATAWDSLFHRLDAEDVPEKQLYKLATSDAAYDLAGLAVPILYSANCSLRVMESLLNQGDEFIDIDIARTPTIPEAWLREFADYVKYTDVVASAAMNESAPEDLLRTLAQDPRPEVRAAVEEGLSYHGYPRDRFHGADNPNTSAATLEQLSRNESHLVRLRVAGNPNTPAAVLEQLAKDSVWWVRYVASGNANTPLAALEEFAKHYDPDVRASVAQNPSAPVELLERIANDAQPKVRDAVLRNPMATAEVMTNFAKHENYRVRVIAAASEKTPVEVLTALAKDKRREVRLAVANNPNAPVVELVFDLPIDRSAAVREAAQGRAA